MAVLRRGGDCVRRRDRKQAPSILTQDLDRRMFEHFEHTADLGIRITAASLDELFVDAARGLFAAVVQDLETVQPTVRVEVALPVDQVEYLLFDWLKTLLYRFDVEHLL